VNAKTLAIRTLLVGVAIAFVSAGIASRIKTSNLDTANFLSFMDKSVLLTPLVSDYATHHNGLFDLIGADASNVCSVIENTNKYSRNFFPIHAYLFPTVMSLSGWIIPLPTNWIAGIWLAASLVGGLLSLVVFLSKTKIPSPAILVFLGTIIFYPVLSNSFVGQIYVDLLIFGPACASTLLVWWMKNRSLSVWPWTLLLLICLASVSERGAYLAGVIGIVYSVILFGLSLFKIREALLVFLVGLLAWCWMLIWTKFIQSNIAYQQLSITGAIARVESLMDQPARPQFLIFVMTSVVLLLLSMISGRGFLITVLAIAPNLLISTGGAELSGFYTHYHQTYLAILLSTASIGFIRLSSWISRSNGNIQRASCLILAIVIMSTSFLTWSKLGRKTSFAQLRFDTRQLILPPKLNRVSNERVEKLEQLTTYLKTLQPEIISGGESIMPALFLAGFKDVEYWPIGVGVADVVVAPLIEGTPRVYPFGDIWGNGDELQNCTNTLLETKYKLVQKFEDYAVYEKTKVMSK
jgi:hypothetical protein